MRANRAYTLSHARGGPGPAFLADTPFGAGGRDRRDRIEVTAIADGEPLLFWELAPREAAGLVRRLRAELATLEAEEFLALWAGADRDRGIADNR